ncbi:MAG TPA: DUF2326 domain-containing protein [Lactovum miscens]|uniref:DUF2326 domain-containing protein n=1 Tax=Lactovum miscens TaxID=190387 RepID=UPI002ED7ECC1
MFIKELSISSNKEIIRRIEFHLGSNLIVDETDNSIDIETGNNIGKTTVLALIDYCLGGNSEQIYKDSETGREITFVKDFLTVEEVLVSLTLTDDLENVDISKDIVISRNFLTRNKRILTINGKPIKSAEFENELSKLILQKDNLDKPSFRQIISHNIRYKEKKIDNTLKFLSNFTSPLEYETLFLYMLGIPVQDRTQINTKIKSEKEFKKRIEKNLLKNEAKFQLEIVHNNIKSLEDKKRSLNINERYENDLDELNQLKRRASLFGAKIGDLELKRELLIEAEEELRQEVSDINLAELREIYQTAQAEVSGIEKTFEEMVNYHNKMIIERIRFVSQDIPKVEEDIQNFNIELSRILKVEKELVVKISSSDTFEDLEKIIGDLNNQYQKLGELTNFLEQVEQVDTNISKLKVELDTIESGRFTKEFDEILENKINQFNIIFSNVSKELYGEQYGISQRIKETQTTNVNYYDFFSFNLNTSSGKKQGEIICFDIAYILYAREKNIPQLEFLLNDKKELMHGNQLKKISDFAKEKKVQLIFSILKDKLPVELINEEHIVLTLSDKDKLFRIEQNS